MRRSRPLLVLILILLGTARDASADLTAFLGANRTPSNRIVGGVALSVSLLAVGFEFEYSDSGADAAVGAPSLRTGMFNLELRAPAVAGLRFYGTVGGWPVSRTAYRTSGDRVRHQHRWWREGHHGRPDRRAVRLPGVLVERRPAPRQPAADLRRVQRGVLRTRAVLTGLVRGAARHDGRATAPRAKAKSPTRRRG